MKPVKAVFLKTYGKQRRKLSAWISPDNRKQAFDNTRSTDGDISVFESPKPANKRVARPAKTKAMLCLDKTSPDEDNMSSPSFLRFVQQSKMTRKKKKIRSSTAVPPSKRKTKRRLTETSSDEENIRRPTQHSQAARKSRLVSEPGASLKQKGQPFPWISESEEDSTSTIKCPKSSVQMKTDSVDHLPSVGRFVTRRRRTVAAKPKLPKATLGILNSSDEFAYGTRRIPRPSRGRKVPLAFVGSSAENSLNVPGTTRLVTSALREISLNEFADHSLGSYPRKPIFCSTPSAGPLSKKPQFKPIPISDHSSATPPSMSVSCIGVLSTFQEDLDSLGKFSSPPFLAPPIELQSEEKSLSSCGEREPTGDLFMKAASANKKRSCREEAKSHSDDMKTKHSGESPGLNLLSSDDSESNSQFLTASGELEWLIEALKEKCLTVPSTVQLERLCTQTVTQLCGQTTYSSCLGYSRSGYSHQTDEHALGVASVQTIDLSQSTEPSSHLQLSVTDNRTSGYLQALSITESPEHVASVTNSQFTNTSLVDCKHSAQHSSTYEPMEQSASEMQVEPTHHKDGSDDFIMGTQLQANDPVQTLFTEEDAAALKNKWLTQKCTVQLQKCALSQQLQRFRRQQVTGLTCNTKSSPQDPNRSETGSKHATCDVENVTLSREITEKKVASKMLLSNNSGAVAWIQSTLPEAEDKSAVLTTLLKEKCLSNKPIIKMRRLTVSQLKEIQQLKDRNLKPRTGVIDTYSDDQIKNPHQMENDTNYSHEDTLAINDGLKKRGSTSSKETTSSDSGEGLRNSCNIRQKRKNTSRAPKPKKRRSTSAEQPGTTRKACVSGLSVSRWKNKDSASTHVFRSRATQMGRNKTVDCSITELISEQKQSRKVLGTTRNFSTPVRASRSSLLSLLADFTPNTHTWSRLKAALSVHRKGLVLHTPRSSSPTNISRTDLVDFSQDLFATPFRPSLPKRLPSQLLSSSSLVGCEEDDLSDAEKVYAECDQQRPLLWEECITPQRMKQCVKIGEGTFGEVFSTTNASGEVVALKVIPVEGSEQVNGEDQKTFGEILHEIIISKELSSLKEKQQNQTHGFIGVIDLHCVQGCYPPEFLKAWDTFDRRKGSENDRPDFFQKDQLFIILEFEFGGSDLENSNGTLTSLGVAKSILHQVTAALSVAEQELKFEHRDLHWGNVLVKTTEQKKGSFLLNGAVHVLETKGVLVRIIDYSLSRLEIDDLTVSCDISKDEELFMGHGDYQFDIYRLMREENRNNWSAYNPHTNVLWLHYLCSKLLSMKYRGSGGRRGKDMREELTGFYDSVLQYASATEVLQNCPMFQ